MNTKINQYNSRQMETNPNNMRQILTKGEKIIEIKKYHIPRQIQANKTIQENSRKKLDVFLQIKKNKDQSRQRQMFAAFCIVLFQYLH